MSTYETIAVVLSSIAITLSVPAVVLSVRQSLKMNFKIIFRPENNSEVLISKDKNGNYHSVTRFSIINKSDQDNTIRKIIVLDNGKEEELIVNAGYSSSTFTNIPFQNNAIISRPLEFSISNLPHQNLTFKIYTNRKCFKFKIRYRLA